MTTCIRKCKFWASFIWKKKPRNLFCLDFSLKFFGKRGRERKEREGGVWFSEVVVAREKDGGTFLIFLFFV